MNVSELCREFGISRACGNKWLKRLQEAGHDVKAVEERSGAVRSDAIEVVPSSA